MQITGTDVKENLSYSIGFIGGSRAGTAFANYLLKSGLNICGFYSHSFDSAIVSAKITKTKAYFELDSLVLDSDIIFISVKDFYIQDIWQQICRFNLSDKIICHLSGFLSSTIFDHSDKYCKGVASLHIPISFANKNTIPEEIKSSVFVIEGNELGLDVISKISSQTNNQTLKIDPMSKSQYHAACVFSSSLVLALLKKASNMIEKSLEGDKNTLSSERLVLNLASSAINNSMLNNDILSAITGPIIRNDADSVKRHLESLSEEEDRNLYQILSCFLVENINLEVEHEISLKNILKG